MGVGVGDVEVFTIPDARVCVKDGDSLLVPLVEGEDELGVIVVRVDCVLGLLVTKVV